MLLRADPLSGESHIEEVFYYAGQLFVSGKWLSDIV